jgi:hypothetical protein
VGYVARTVLKFSKSFDNMSVHLRTMDTHLLYINTVPRRHRRGVINVRDSGKMAAADRRA